MSIQRVTSTYGGNYGWQGEERHSDEGQGEEQTFGGASIRVADFLNMQKLPTFICQVPIQPTKVVKRKIIDGFFYCGATNTITLDARDLVNMIKSHVSFINTTNEEKLK